MADKRCPSDGWRPHFSVFTLFFGLIGFRAGGFGPGKFFPGSLRIAGVSQFDCQVLENTVINPENSFYFRNRDWNAGIININIIPLAFLLDQVGKFFQAPFIDFDDGSSIAFND